MATHVRIENNEVVECLGYFPNRPGDWREAIDIEPVLNPVRQIRGSHTFDISKNPVEIVWGVIDLSPEDRKMTIQNKLLSELKMKVRQEMDNEFTSGGFANMTLVNSLIEQIRSKKQEIDALVTHEQIDEYMQANNLTL